MLARMGADVIKIDNITPVYAPNITIIYGMCTNRGKKSILLNYKTEKGKRQLQSLIQTSDIIIVNTTQNRLGILSINNLRKMNPNIILVHFDAWSGPTEKGHMRNYLGYDDNIQAAQGIMERFGGGYSHIEEHAHIGTIDVIAGVTGAFIAVYGLLQRLCKKKSMVCRTSLAAVAQYIQFSYTCGSMSKLKYQALVSFDRLGSVCRGEHILKRCYEAKDGWFIFVASHHVVIDILHDVLSTVGNIKYIPSQTEMYLCETFKTKKIEHWKRKLNKYSIIKLNSMTELRKKYNSNLYLPYGPSIQFITSTQDIGNITMIAPLAIRMSHIRTILSHSPKYGSHNMEILKTSCTWTSDFLPYLNTCPVCHTITTRHLSLNCNHIICIRCAAQCSIKRQNKCPLCQSEEEMNINNMKAKVTTYRNDYSNWRKGECKGAYDMERIRKVDMNIYMKNKHKLSRSFSF